MIQFLQEIKPNKCQNWNKEQRLEECQLVIHFQFKEILKIHVKAL